MSVIFRFLLVALSIIPVLGFSFPKGEFDLRTVAKAEKLIPLQAEWEFHWNKLLTPDSFRARSYTPLYVKVPASWSEYEFEGNQLPASGFATYRLLIQNPTSCSNTMIKFTGISTACKIWLNDSLVGALGIVGTSHNSTIAKRQNIYVILPKAKQSTLVIQVSNFDFFSGGIHLPVEIGPAKEIFAQDRLKENVEMMGFGLMLMMFFMNMILFLKIRRSLSFLLLGLICLTMLYRSTIVYDGSLLIFRLFPTLDFSLAKKIEVILLHLTVFLFPMFIQCLFPEDTNRKIIRGFQVAGLILLLADVITPLAHHQILFDVYNVGILTALGFALFVSFRAIRKKRRAASVMVIGITVSLVFVVLEILALKRYVHPEFSSLPNFATIGVLLFLFFQFVAVSSHFSSALTELENMSHNLELTVQKRTEQLSRANLVKDKIFSIISHDLKSPLNSLKGIMELATSNYVGSEEIKTLMKPIRQTLQTSTQLLDDLLSWSSVQFNGMTYSPSEMQLVAIVDENINLYKGAAFQKQITLINRVGPSIFVHADPNMIRLVLRNLISNACKFTPTQGSVTVATEVNESTVWVSVTDTGVGMTPEIVEKLFESGAKRSSPGTDNEKGTGIGLLLVKEFIEKNGGTLRIDSQPGTGSTFSFSLPKSRNTIVVQPQEQTLNPHVAFYQRSLRTRHHAD